MDLPPVAAARAAPTCDVLVVGLGPVGQLLALLLRSTGIHVVAVDRADGPHGLPRAATTDDEVLRILQSVGVDEAVLAGAQAQDGVSFITAAGRRVNVVRTGGGQLGQPPLVALHQPTLERALVGALAGVDVRWGVSLERLEQDADGVHAVLGGEELRARYVVGCDGAGSPVRGMLGLAFTGSSFRQRWLVVDALVDRPLARVPHPCFVGDPERPTVTLPMGPGRHRWEWMLHPGEPEAALLDPAAIEGRMARWLSPGERAEVERALVYTFHSRTASRWRQGRCFLAGDAAHVMPPFAGQGFSSGARDVGNLAWKLAAVLQGAPDSLLDTYEQERRPHVAAMQAFAERWGGAVQTTRPRLTALRDRALGVLDETPAGDLLRAQAKPLPTYGRGAFAERPKRIPAFRGVGALFPQPTLPDGRRLDEALAPGWAAVSTGAPEVCGLPAVALPGDPWLAKHRAEWAILRPDRFVFACGGAADETAARAALEATLGGEQRS